MTFASRLRDAFKLRSLYARLSLGLYFVVICLVVVHFYVQWFLFQWATAEQSQRLAWNVADALAREVQPLLIGPFTSSTAEEIRKFFARREQTNPSQNFYLLAEDGTILAGSQQQYIKTVQTAPLEQFLRFEPNRKLPLLGDDPLGAGKGNIFSVAEVRIDGRRGFLYVILESVVSRGTVKAIRDLYTLRGGTFLGIFSAIAACLLGSVIFSRVTRHYRNLVSAITEMTEQNSLVPVPVEGTDEVAQLGTVINKLTGRMDELIGQLKEKDRLRRDLIASVSHDLHAPIGLISSYLDLLLEQDSVLSGSQRRDFIEGGVRSAKRLGILIEDLFELSKLEARDRQPELVQFIVSELIDEEIIPAYKSLAEQKNVTIVSWTGQSRGVVYADVAMMLRIIANLVENAIRYNRIGGRVEIAVYDRDRKVLIEISDNGPGIETADLQNIFEPFFRGRMESRLEGRPDGNLDLNKGSGLGLAIVKRLVEAQHGNIEVRSVVGSGTTFSIWLVAG